MAFLTPSTVLVKSNLALWNYCVKFRFVTDLSRLNMTEPSMVDELKSHAVEAAQLLKALANENRLMILCSLAQGELNVSELNDRVHLSQSALSQHLAWLRRENLVQTRRDAQTIYYSLQGTKAKAVIQVLQSIYCANLQVSQ